MANLNGYTHTLPGTCSGVARLNDDWNDCISSIQLFLGANYHLCVYVHNQWTFLTGDWVGPFNGGIVSAPASFLNDTITSWHFRYGSACPDPW
jgi:hypothetical protein